MLHSYFFSIILDKKKGGKHPSFLLANENFICQKCHFKFILGMQIYIDISSRKTRDVTPFMFKKRVYSFFQNTHQQTKNNTKDNTMYIPNITQNKSFSQQKFSKSIISAQIQTNCIIIGGAK